MHPRNQGCGTPVSSRHHYYTVLPLDVDLTVNWPISKNSLLVNYIKLYMMSLYLHVVVLFQHISVASCSQSMLKHSFWTHVRKFSDYILRQELAHIIRLDF